MLLTAKLMKVVITVRLGMVPRAGVEPGRPFGQRILSLMNLGNLASRTGVEPVSPP
jgi:hypothetical protein